MTSSPFTGFVCGLPSLCTHFVYLHSSSCSCSFSSSSPWLSCSESVPSSSSSLLSPLTLLYSLNCTCLFPTQWTSCVCASFFECPLPYFFTVSFSTSTLAFFRNSALLAGPANRRNLCDWVGCLIIAI